MTSNWFSSGPNAQPICALFKSAYPVANDCNASSGQLLKFHSDSSCSPSPHYSHHCLSFFPSTEENVPITLRRTSQLYQSLFHSGWTPPPFPTIRAADPHKQICTGWRIQILVSSWICRKKKLVAFATPNVLVTPTYARTHTHTHTHTQASTHTHPRAPHTRTHTYRPPRTHTRPRATHTCTHTHTLSLFSLSLSHTHSLSSLSLSHTHAHTPAPGRHPHAHSHTHQASTHTHPQDSTHTHTHTYTHTHTTGLHAPAPQKLVSLLTSP